MISHSNKVLQYGAEPINFQAACLFFKAPWWAFMPEETKRVISRQSIEVNYFLDLTKAPPKEVPDRRGITFYGHVVIGWAFKKREGNRTYDPRDGLHHMPDGRTKLRSSNRSRWYVLCADGTVTMLHSKHLGRCLKMSKEEFKPLAGVRLDKFHPMPLL